jgi:hypothetical protein
VFPWSQIYGSIPVLDQADTCIFVDSNTILAAYNPAAEYHPAIQHFSAVKLEDLNTICTPAKISSFEPILIFRTRLDQTISLTVSINTHAEIGIRDSAMLLPVCDGKLIV